VKNKGDEVSKLRCIAVLGMIPWSCGAADIVDRAISPVWSNLPLILEKGGMPAVILLFGWLYLRSVNSKWARAIESMQAQFAQQQQMLMQHQTMTLTVVQNNTAMLSTLSTKLGVGCMLFQRTAEQMSADREAERRSVEITRFGRIAGGFGPEVGGEVDGTKKE